jgi:RNA polymerase sigma factor (sigma-70 family)
MSAAPLNAVVRHVRHLSVARAGGVPGDEDLLRAFLANNDQAAFAAIVRRHGTMVLRICQRMLGDHHDAEDAFQATFLVLAQQAASIRKRESLASWLHGAAFRMAGNAKRTRTRRRRHEQQLGETTQPPNPSFTAAWHEVQEILDAEIQGLPEIYRGPFVLCCLEHASCAEAAQRLGLAEATVRQRLTRARKRLQQRLTRRGISLCTVLAALAVSHSGAVAGSLVAETTRAATHIAAGEALSTALVTENVIGLVHGAKKTMVLTKSTVSAFLVLTAAVACAGLAFGGRLLAMAQPGEEPVAAVQSPAEGAGKNVRAAPGRKKGDAPVVIRGKVLGHDGKPVAGAELLNVTADCEGTHLGATDTQGNFTVSLPRGQKGGVLLARAAGHGCDFRRLARDKRIEVTFKLPRDNPIRGRVIDTQGKPIAGATVFVTALWAFDNGSADRFVNEWKTMDEFRFLNSFPGGDRQLGLLRNWKRPQAGAATLWRTTTSKGGQFETTGIGRERVASLYVCGPGLADTEAIVVNSPKFDAGPANAAVAANTARLGMKESGLRYRLFGPALTLVVEQERLIRGVVKDRDTGKPRVGVEVFFWRLGNVGPAYGVFLNRTLSGKTDAEGKYEIRGSRRYANYIVETGPDLATGHLPCQMTVSDTPGVDSLVVDFNCARGVVVTGKLTDKGTGKPVMNGQVRIDVLHDNPFVAKYPSFSNLGHTGACVTGKDGSFQLITIPGPVLLLAHAATRSVTAHGYRRARPDPKYPQYFRPGPSYYQYGYANQPTPLWGNWCKVLEPKKTDTAIKQDIELEAEPRPSGGK